MGFKVNWEIEAERERLPDMGEDMELAHAGRRALLRFIGLLLVLLLVVGGIVAAILLRLRYVDFEVEQALRDTVSSEVTALRVGDSDLFLRLQRSASEDWLTVQRASFDNYQALKQQSDVSLAGTIRDIAVDGQRGRVIVEEIIGGAPYARVWFYWRYEDGWFHVPPDFTFWGDPGTIRAGSVEVSYQGLDSRFAQAASEQISIWLSRGCELLGCTAPDMRVVITPADNVATQWLSQDPPYLEMQSPYLRGARTDALFDPVQQLEAANLVARLLVERALQPAPDASGDAAYAHRAAASALVGQFLNVPSGATLIDSVLASRGASGLMLFLGRVTTGEPIVSALTSPEYPAPASDPALDWRDYLAWRLGQEGITAQLVSATLSSDGGGNPIITASGTNANGAVQFTFALINGAWTRTG
ncbi:MAG: hypothetical protein KME04_00095 [Pleurocapsa minor GSE-CHR-MK-17-07R]|jgi:hypothetical protein|nr:hypothetical protein [Pleurocapsa minor GSE-CHR-MK 17-07R]